jgi:hypothetical protein
MSSVIISGDTSGAVTIAAPAVAGTNTLTLQAGTATNSMNTLATAVASTSGTSINFTDIPAWVKRITVMFNGVSTNGTSSFLIQIGSGSVTTTGYVAQAGFINTTGGASGANSTAGFICHEVAAADTRNGSIFITLLSGNIYTCSGNLMRTSSNGVFMLAGAVTLGGTLDRIRITTVNGTDTFDAGTVNILYEG